MMTNAQFYFALGVPLVGILVNIAAIAILGTNVSSRISSIETVFNSRISGVEDRLTRLEDRVHQGQDLLIGKVGELDTRIARLEERLP